MKVLSQDTIANVKSYIEAKEGIPAAYQCIKMVQSVGVVTLADDHTLADYKLTNGHTKLWLKVDSSFWAGMTSL